MNFSFNGKTDNLIMIEDGFEFPSMSTVTNFGDSSHSGYRYRRRLEREPYSFTVPFFVKNKQNTMTRDEALARVVKLFQSDSPKRFKVKDSDWHFIGEFNGPFNSTHYINGFMSFELDFVSQYSHKFYDVEKTQIANKTVTINSKTQLPTIPLIELSNLTGNDVQISISGDSFRRIRLTGELPSKITIDIENERIYETNSGLNMMKLLRYDSAFEDFKIKNNNVVVVTNASDTAQAKLIYKELLL